MMSIASEVRWVEREAGVPVAKCSMLRVGAVCSGWVLWDIVDKGMGPVFPYSRLPQIAKGW